MYTETSYDSFCLKDIMKTINHTRRNPMLPMFDLEELRLLAEWLNLTSDLSDEIAQTIRRGYAKRWSRYI